MLQTFQIIRLNPAAVRDAADALGAVLKDAVDGGASVSFMADLTIERAVNFWRSAADAAEADGRVVLAAADAQGILGVVQVIPAGVDNQPHRGDVSKMLVHRRGRRQGIGEALLRAAEQAGRELGLTLLTLDTAEGGSGERLYTRGGWTRVGIIPDYALMPDGALTGTVLFYKRVGD
jgi:GNAT superfamily N-acetyltransferase